MQYTISLFLFDFMMQGYSRFQLKLGGDYLDDIERIKTCHAILSKNDVLIGDANTGKQIRYFHLFMSNLNSNMHKKLDLLDKTSY